MHTRRTRHTRGTWRTLGTRGACGTQRGTRHAASHLEVEQAHPLEPIEAVGIRRLEISCEADADDRVVDHREESRMRPVDAPILAGPRGAADEGVRVGVVDVDGQRDVHREEVVEGEGEEEDEVDRDVVLKHLVDDDHLDPHPVDGRCGGMAVVAWGRGGEPVSR